MIVVAIIGILVAVALPQFASMSDDAKIAKSKQDIDVIVGALTRYNAMEPRKAEALGDLKGKYMVKLPVDPWGADYFLDLDAGVIGSPGGDGQKDTRDDISISYLPDPILMDVKFLDVGSPRVFLMTPAGTMSTDRTGKFSAPNDRRAGAGDILELTFARPVWVGAYTKPTAATLAIPAAGQPNATPPHVEIADIERTIALSADDYVLLTKPIAPANVNDAGIPDSTDLLANVSDLGAVTGATFAPQAYIPWGEPDKILIVLGDNPTLIPGAQYFNLQGNAHSATANTFVDRSTDKVPVQPASRPMQLRL